jgi:hypothetical protein
VEMVAQVCAPKKHISLVLVWLLIVQAIVERIVVMAIIEVLRQPFQGLYSRVMMAISLMGMAVINIVELNVDSHVQMVFAQKYVEMEKPLLINVMMEIQLMVTVVHQTVLLRQAIPVLDQKLLLQSVLWLEALT